MTSKKFRSCYYVIYDFDDNVFAYVDNIDELLDIMNTNRINNIVSRLKMNKNKFANILIGDKEYKLYVFS